MAKYAAAKLLAALNSDYQDVCDDPKCSHPICQDWDTGMAEYREIAHARICQCEDCLYA